MKNRKKIVMGTVPELAHFRRKNLPFFFVTLGEDGAREVYVQQAFEPAFAVRLQKAEIELLWHVIGGYFASWVAENAPNLKPQLN